MCSAIPWFSRVQAAIGIFSLLGAGVGWVVQRVGEPPEDHGMDDVFEAGTFSVQYTCTMKILDFTTVVGLFYDTYIYRSRSLCLHERARFLPVPVAVHAL